MYSTKIYENWKPKQIQKYQKLLPIISKHLNKQMSVLDIGIGPGWIYKELKKHNITFKKIVGIEPYKEMIKKENKKKLNIEYHNTTFEQFKTNEKFDLIISFDSIHLLKEPKNILKYLKPTGIALISTPTRHKNLLKQFEDNIILKQGKIGQEEIDYFILIKNQLPKRKLEVD